MCSEVHGHENPVFLGGSPQIKTRSVSQIMARQSSDTGRHLLSEPGTPLSPPAHGDVFFPVEGRRHLCCSLTSSVTVSSSIRIKTDSDKRHNKSRCTQTAFVAQTHSNYTVPETGESTSYPGVPLPAVVTVHCTDRPQRLALLVAVHFLLCNSVLFPVQNVHHLPVSYKTNFETTHFKMCTCQNILKG